MHWWMLVSMWHVYAQKGGQRVIKHRAEYLRQYKAAELKGATMPFVIEVLGPLWAQQH